MRHSARMPDDAAEPLRSIHVVAGVITDPRGRILLTRRDGSSDMAGLWEFPGGKREPGETPEAALIRELREVMGRLDRELGIGLAVQDDVDAPPANAQAALAATAHAGDRGRQFHDPRAQDIGLGRVERLGPQHRPSDGLDVGVDDLDVRQFVPDRLLEAADLVVGLP